ncbi:MAG: metallophosphoesterase [Clostridia bacterium]|nr:metallophosphoesterase [Clostridia bacterium]MBP5593069.1 metallophosphoesterase [Clostridia bacterium]MBP5649021.1 metallophosphoesterase [Clostridia bacterium]
MKIFAISDFHLSISNPKPMDIFGHIWDNYLESIEKDWEKKVSDDDIVLIPGDLSWAMTLDGVKSDLEYFNRFKGYKVIIRGNHDYWWSHSISKVRSILPQKMYAIQCDAVKIGRAVICGSRLWTTPEPGRKQEAQDETIYNREKIRLQMSLEEASKIRQPEDKLYVMLHFPPFNSKFLPSPYTDIISSFSPDAAVYGHLHGKDIRVSYVTEIGGVKYYLTSCDLVGNKLVYIDEI